ncbi:MAG: hypothetical protein HOH43_13235 [Candidatus Latescibacteria bacterium]|jgi:hypothetical protein|nr:hypothetical protein [Candidatus Latescibacterota bacterium]
MNRSSPLRQSWIWLTYLALFGLSIPWYLPSDAPPILWFGLPHWVVISLIATFVIACFTAMIIYLYWPNEDKAGV